MATLSKGTLFPEEIVGDLFNLVKGKSSLAKLSRQMPVSFVGNEIFTFSMDDEVQIIGENGAKPAGSVTVEPVKVVPIKVEYGTRVSDEFIYAAAEKRLDILRAFSEGFARKMARGLDIMAMHGVNPRTGQPSSLIKSHFDQGTNTVEYDGDPDAAIDEAVTLLGQYDVTGIAVSKYFASELAKVKSALGGRMYPELSWGGQPNEINGVPASINNTVTVHDGVELDPVDIAIIGDFESYFRWGYAKEIPMDVIQYGDPDGTGKDLKHYNQVYLRCEAYLGWAVMSNDAFARVVAEG